LEDCESLTNLINSLQSGLQEVDSFYESEQYDELQAKVEEINATLAEKGDFFYWRSLRLTYQENLPVSDQERDEFIEGFWPVQVSPSGNYLAYGAGNAFTMINLETGEIEKENIPLVSIDRKKDIASNYSIDDIGSMHIRARVEDEPGVYRIYSFATDGRQLVPTSAMTPIRFVDKVVAEYDPGKLATPSFAFMKGPDYDSTGYSGLPFTSLKADTSERYAYTINTNRELHYWDLKRDIYLDKLAEGVREFLILSDNTDLIILDDDQLSFFYFVEPSTPSGGSPGRFEKRVLATGPKDNFYTKITKSTDNKNLFAIEPSGWLDIYDLESMQLSRKIDLSKILNGRHIQSLDYGVNDQLIISTTEIIDNNIGGSYFMFSWQKVRKDEVLILQPSWREE